MSRGKRYNYEDYHRTNEKGELEKKCTMHEEFFPNESEWLPCNNEYFYVNKKNKGDELHPYCKKCSVQKSMQQFFDDPEKNIQAHIKYQKTRKYKDEKKHQRQDIKEYQAQYRRNNKDKMSIYNAQRQQHKNHKINLVDLKELYKYANNSCMYCGMPEKESLVVYKQKLHKDHAFNEGSNGIDNCILACKGCNCSKNIYDWNVWYIPENPIYKEEYYIKIDNWLKYKNKLANIS